MSGRGRYRNNRNRNQPNLNSIEGETAASLAGNSPIVAVFLKAARHLTNRQDRHERLVKLSRDITIESKRIIFLLHTAITIEKTKEEIVNEAKGRIGNLLNGPIKAIALELENAPAHLHSRAVTAGLQEFVEARTLCSLMENKQIITYPEVRKEFIFTIKPEDGEERTVATLLPHLDYMLGLADLSGELMRQAINGIASGDKEVCLFACEIIRKLYAGFLGLFSAGQLITSKLNTTRTNVHKVEYALYAFVVRGSEAVPRLKPPRKLKPAGRQSAHDDDDQGCFN